MINKSQALSFSLQVNIAQHHQSMAHVDCGTLGWESS